MAKLAKKRVPFRELLTNNQQDLDDFQTGPPPAKKQRKKTSSADRFAHPKTGEDWRRDGEAKQRPYCPKHREEYCVGYWCLQPVE